MISPDTIFQLRDIRDGLEEAATEALKEDRMEDHRLLGQAYHKLASIPQIGYREELK